MQTESLDRAGGPLEDAIRAFNDEEFFLCHDLLEELWAETLGPEREFLQGLIHAAVALFHFGEGNLGGARKMYHSAVRYLAPYRPAYATIDLERLMADLADCFAELRESNSGYPAGVVLDADRIPRLHRVPAAERGDA